MTNFGEYASFIWNVAALSDPERLKMIRDLYAAEVYDARRKAASNPA